MNSARHILPRLKLPPAPLRGALIAIPSSQPYRSYSSHHHDTSKRKLNLPINYNDSTYLSHTPSSALAHPELPAGFASKTKRMNLYSAINDALATILSTDSKSLIFGEDVSFGGVFRCTMGLLDQFGAQRVFNTPLTEQGIMGFAIGLSSSGYTALPEIQFADYLFPAFDQIHNEASKWRYRSGGAKVFNSGNLVIRMPTGAVGHGGLYHSQSPEGFFLGMQGVKVVIPRGPAQAKGLLIAAARCGDPVVFMEPKILYRGAVEEVPVGDYELPLGKAQVVKEGKDVTLISWGTMLYTCEMAAKAAKERLGVDVEVIDLRTVHPWDKETVTNSVLKTGRCVIVHEASRAGGVGESVGAEVQERCFTRLEAPIERVTGWDVPMPLVFEPFIVPDVARVFHGIKKTVEY
ncbi:thiamine diphosphate-binding protein [Pyronema domesticum]|uniref:3-methyl-2-oxobutanoate dehydrogenase (2-methylpropanoyl-transferring) n=1 Tax=Pyronema omphalodes (strain CBS 100304) TaxID=1076935 RepID=U4LBB1_PYROM|nr:thiamine diphosphate-binding protein [Pyronema domesticum]CCX16487.1 Similar to 2-oxoisovalerate dehydrogenase subunit beta, mitochondrial; acc. no. Q55FN7 [Pyronema omphalodes CBS 100304]